MNGKSKPYAILVFGAPMSGKTTFATQFSKKYNSLFLNFEALHEEHHISRKLAFILLNEFIKTKQTLVIEGAINTEQQRNEIRKVLVDAGYEPVLLWVQTDSATIRQRLRRKYKNVTEAKAHLDNAYKHLEAPSEAENCIVLSGKHTFITQCKAALTGISNLHNK